MAKSKQAVRTRQRASRSSSASWYKSSSATSAYTFAGLAALLALVLVLLRGEPLKKGDLKVARNKPPSAPANVKRSWKRTSIGPGKGVVATQAISTGSLIIFDTPFVTIPETENRTVATEYLLQTVDRMSPSVKTDFFNLPFTGAHLSKGAGAAELAANIFESNAITTGKSSSVFKNACYINHSCNANADFFYRDDLDALVVQAVRDIAEGEEIFCPHFDASVLTREQRQAHMQDSRGTSCDCSACSLKGQALEESDARRSQLGQIRQLIIDWSNNAEVDHEAVLTGIDIAYQLLAEEDYRADLGWWAGNAVQVCAAHEDEEGVMKWAEIAAKHYALEAGSDSPQVKTLSILAKEPRRSSAWGQRTIVPEEDPVDFDSLEDASTDETDAEETLAEDGETEEPETPESDSD